MFHVFVFHLSQFLFSRFKVNVFTLIGEFHLTCEFHLKNVKNSWREHEKQLVRT